MSVILSKLRENVGSAAETVTSNVSTALSDVIGSHAHNDDEFDDALDGGDRIVLTHSVLDERKALRHVRHPGAGASVLFVGTTRNEFHEKAVQSLEYTAYSAMARKSMAKLVKAERAKHNAGGANAQEGEVKRIYLAHRLGSVETEQPSILVCVSSAHRKASFEACEALLEDVKRVVPIWKKEVYSGEHAGEAEWKANDRSHWKRGDAKADAVQPPAAPTA